MRRFARSFGFALEGLAYMARSQPNFAIELGLGAAAVGAGVVLGVTHAELAVIVLTIGFVLAMEAVNTAVERAVDATEKPPSVAAKHAKDAAAGAVLVAAVTSLGVAILVFGPRVATLLGK